jgi:hypothetical protein
VTAIVPGLALAGFHGGTAWPVLGWLCVSTIGGFVGGFLIAPSHRLAGAVGGMLGAPLGLLALYFYGRNRVSMFRAEAFVVFLVGSLPGVGLYFVLRLLTDVLFPKDESPRRSRNRLDSDDDDDDDDDDDEDDEPRRKRRDDEEPRRGRRRRYEDD